MATRTARHSAPGPSDRVDRTLLVRSRGIVSEPSTAVRPAPSGAVLTATKIEIPGVGSGLVPRARLVALLTGASEAKLALIHAPVGSGKTTLLAEWHAAAEERRPFAWLSLDRGDNDPVRFLEGVIAALQAVEPHVGRQALVDLAGPVSLTDVVLPSLINDLTTASDRL